jgi:hypothetical protein
MRGQGRFNERGPAAVGVDEGVIAANIPLVSLQPWFIFRRIAYSSQARLARQLQIF